MNFVINEKMSLDEVHDIIHSVFLYLKENGVEQATAKLSVRTFNEDGEGYGAVDKDRLEFINDLKAPLSEPFEVYDIFGLRTFVEDPNEALPDDSTEWMTVSELKKLNGNSNVTPKRRSLSSNSSPVVESFADLQKQYKMDSDAWYRSGAGAIDSFLTFEEYEYNSHRQSAMRLRPGKEYPTYEEHQNKRQKEEAKRKLALEKEIRDKARIKKLTKEVKLTIGRSRGITSGLLTPINSILSSFSVIYPSKESDIKNNFDGFDGQIPDSEFFFRASFKTGEKEFLVEIYNDQCEMVHSFVYSGLRSRW